MLSVTVKTTPRRLARLFAKKPAWPITSGDFVVGDATALVTVCTLTSSNLNGTLSKLPGVAISGRVYTVNLEIEKIILNVMIFVTPLKYGVVAYKVGINVVIYAMSH